MNMKNRWKKGIALFAVVALIMTACTGSFEDINNDPDAYPAVPHTNVLGYGIRYVSSNIWNDLGGYGTWAGYINKVQYPDLQGGIIPSNNTYGNRWLSAYVVNSQFKEILKLTEEDVEGNKNMRAVCRIWQNYNWLYLLDGWGDIPYTDALKGSEEEGSILQTKYDSQEDVFRSVMDELASISNELANGFGTDALGAGDFLFNGDMEKWQRFCNSLRLRMAMRVSGVWPDVAQRTIEEICGNPSKFPVIDSNDNAADFWWQGSGTYFEPWYSDSRSRDDYGLSDIFIDHLKEMDDPRLHSIAKPATVDGEYRGVVNGLTNLPPLNQTSRIGAIYRDDPSGFSPYFQACETYYILAEAALLGWNVGMSAQEAYETAVRLSMDANEISEADADAYLAGKGKWDNTKERIWWDMWVGLFKNNYEAWNLYRRTGVPTTNYIPVESAWKGIHNVQPMRLPYPENQYIYNDVFTIEAASAQGIVDHCWGAQLFWDKRTGVN